MTVPSSSVAAVLVDANVLYSRVLRDFVLYSADAELISVMWSRSILDEVTRHLIANIDGFTEASSRRLIDAMNGAFPYAEITPRANDYRRLADVTLPDEDDRHVIAAAVAGGATVLCTANVKDFPVSVLAGFGIEVRRPDELLGSLTIAANAGGCSSTAGSSSTLFKRRRRTTRRRSAQRRQGSSEPRPAIGLTATTTGTTGGRERADPGGSWKTCSTSEGADWRWRCASTMVPRGASRSLSVGGGRPTSAATARECA